MASAATANAPPASVMDGEGVADAAQANQNALRFEDLTIDDDLPLLDRVIRYCRSGIALQRLVHVKMLAETSETVGGPTTLQTLVPLLQPLVQDPESIIRQHLASQLLPLCVVCMLKNVGGPSPSVAIEQIIEDPKEYNTRHYHTHGYKVVTTTLVGYLQVLVTDTDIDVRRSASDSLSQLALQIKKEDVASVILPIPLSMAAAQQHAAATATAPGQPPPLPPQPPLADGLAEELRIGAANLMAELSGSAEEGLILHSHIAQYVLPTIIALTKDTASFRVRRAAAQALPRVLGGTTSLKDAQTTILPAFEGLARDDMYRVRKSTGECLVDMSRSIMILATRLSKKEAELLAEIRRQTLLPICLELLKDANKFVRHGMMQFLGPFIASFYPFQSLELPSIAQATTGSNPSATSSSGSNHDMAAVAAAGGGGIGSQFFPHASSMVSRLNSSGNNTTTSSPTPTPASLDSPDTTQSNMEILLQALPDFVRANRWSDLSLQAVVAHRKENPPSSADVEAIRKDILPHFCSLAHIQTQDDNTDAEMRVYCAYSYPAVVLLMGASHWDGPLSECFQTLVNPMLASGGDPNDPASMATSPPLPVKRCLASSLHTVAHILGPRLSQRDVLPVLEHQFIRDSDDSVRLNVIRNFPWLLSLMGAEPLGTESSTSSPQQLQVASKKRTEFLQTWVEIVKGEDLLGAHKRSVTNPMLLNWRQRDYVARSLPDLLGLVDPMEAHRLLWPILQMLLLDSVNVVREDAEWSIPLLLRVYCAESKSGSGSATIVDKRWSADVCQEVVGWLKEAILGVSSPSDQQPQPQPQMKNGTVTNNFGKRQLYCRICASVGLALRFGDLPEQEQWDIPFGGKVALARNRKNSKRGGTKGGFPVVRDKHHRYVPFQTLTPAERKHLRRLLVYDLLPPALEMKQDRVTNVRLTLMRALQLMPKDVQELASVSDVLQVLEEEMETWESFNSGDTPRKSRPAPQLAPVMINTASSSTVSSSSHHGSSQTYSEATRELGENRATV